MRPDAASTVVITCPHSRRMVRRDSHWLGLRREQDAADDHAREKYRSDHQNRYAVVSSRRNRSLQLLVQKLPVAPVHGESPFAGNAHKGPAFLFAVYWLFLKKWMHKNLISEIDESRHPTTYFPSLPV